MRATNPSAVDSSSQPRHAYSCRICRRRSRPSTNSLRPTSPSRWTTAFKRQDEEVLQSMRTITNDMSTRFDELKMSIGVDLDELRTGMD
uniref:Predicted protein n=1 Tax=Hordeum vulgare subsp. vulgare TaxID=112509 RepID=F2EIJ8_HORVV|nr:predicted protein [Hordeum vulgare subsp. vulgare]